MCGIFVIGQDTQIHHQSYRQKNVLTSYQTSQPVLSYKHNFVCYLLVHRGLGLFSRTLEISNYWSLLEIRSPHQVNFMRMLRV